MQTKRIYLSPPHMSGAEMDFIRQAFSSNYIAPLGPQVDLFEREFEQRSGVRFALAVSSGTAAMHLGLRILGIAQNDEVFASTLTFIGSISPAIFEGATPVFIDADKNSWNMDPSLLESELERSNAKANLPKAVVPTDLYGQCCNLPRIVEICDKYSVPVICDSAEAVGARYMLKEQSAEFKAEKEENGKSLRTENRGQKADKIGRWRHAGKGAEAASYSFNGNKIITTSGGGMLASDNKKIIDYARFLSQQARESFPHYEHTEIGYNYRMSNILAAIGRGQLRVLDDRVKRKREIFEYYQTALGDLPGIEFIPEPDWSRSNRWLTVILITPEEFGADRERIRLALEAENIEARPVWKPMHMQPCFAIAQSSKLKAQSQSAKMPKKRYRARAIGGKVAEDFFDRGLCLPSGTALSEPDLDRICTIIRSCHSS